VLCPSGVTSLVVMRIMERRSRLRLFTSAEACLVAQSKTVDLVVKQSSGTVYAF
jgi:hypothetical protein